MSDTPQIIGPAVSTSTQRPLLALTVAPHWEKGYQKATRINGAFVCPRCDLLWPLYQDVEVWTFLRGRHHALEWGPGYGFCEECEIAVHEGFDEDYVIDCRSKGAKDV